MRCLKDAVVIADVEDGGKIKVEVLTETNYNEYMRMQPRKSITFSRFCLGIDK